MRLELILVALFLACWSIVLLQMVGVLSMAGTLEMGLRGLYSTAVAVGWLAGNVYVHRSRGLPRELRRRMLLIYLLGPPSLLALLRSMASLDAQLAAPIVPLYASIVFAILFLVPLSLKGAFRTPAEPGD